jgi:hypothetical protein
VVKYASRSDERLVKKRLGALRAELELPSGWSDGLYLATWRQA